MKNESQARTVWWKEPLMWLVLGLPASVAVAGVYTIILANQSLP